MSILNAPLFETKGLWLQAKIKFIFHLHLLEGIVDMAGLASREHGVDLLGPQSGPDVLVVRMVHNVAL